MSDEEEDDDGNLYVPATGQNLLERAWWEAVIELREIAAFAENTADRVSASKAILDYTATLNVGLGDPFIPGSNPHDEDEDE